MQNDWIKIQGSQIFNEFRFREVKTQQQQDIAWRGCLPWLICDGIIDNVNRPMSLEQYALLVSCPWLLAYVQHGSSHSTMYSFVDHHMWPFPNNVLVLPCGWCCWWHIGNPDGWNNSKLLHQIQVGKTSNEILIIIRFICIAYLTDIQREEKHLRPLKTRREKRYHREQGP